MTTEKQPQSPYWVAEGEQCLLICGNANGDLIFPLNKMKVCGLGTCQVIRDVTCSDYRGYDHRTRLIACAAPLEDEVFHQEVCGGNDMMANRNVEYKRYITHITYVNRFNLQLARFLMDTSEESLDMIRAGKADIRFNPQFVIGAESDDGEL